ncbi:hypothetical protein SAMN05216249_10499 [Acetitomaculum ruminis DSM 5522]|uniref:Uncharacterized protein n=2 Tax=Acetitomaculum ruminis TaxID=2382 RepID=A0A1I0WJY5_9FIRM|nr:hypothetical protein SAMN05216249_10499 [Acetitomaculum ruminis DSM 5522]
MFVYYINVPLNEEGVRELDNLDKNISNVATFELNEQEYNYLRKPLGLFSKFDKNFGTIIDVCEEERIIYDDLDKAIGLVQKERKKLKEPEEKKALDIVEDSLKLAQKSKTFWEIDIFLGGYQNE